MADAGLLGRPANGFRRRSVGGKWVGRQSLVKTAAARGGGRRPVFTRDCLPTKLGHPERRSPAFRHDDNQATTPHMQAWRGKDRQETSNFKPMIFGEFYAAGDISFRVGQGGRMALTVRA